MQYLGSRIRYRRRQMRLSQKQMALQNSASFVSKVETGQALPSLSILAEWSNTLETPISELIGDHLLWEAAALTVLHPEKCRRYLTYLPQTPIRQYIEDLSTCAVSLSIPVPKPPPHPCLQYSAAKVLLHRGEMEQAAALCQQALTASDPVWRIRHLALLSQIWTKLGKTDKAKAVRSQFLTVLGELDTERLTAQLPEGDRLTNHDLELVKLSLLWEIIQQFDIQ